MADHAAQTYEQDEGLGTVFSGINVNAYPHPYKGDNRWLIGYKTCTSSSSRSCENHNTALVGNIVDQLKEHEFLAVEQVKFKEFKLLGFDINQRYTGGCKGKSCSSAGNVDLASHVCGSEFEHFPISDIGQKKETIMASTKKSACGAMFVKMKNELPVCESPTTSSIVELAPASWHAAKNIIDNTEKETRCYEGFQPDYNSNVGSTSVPAVHGCKCQKANKAACMFSCGLAYKVPANTKLSCMQHKLCCCSSNNSKFMTTGTKNNIDLMSTSIGIPSKSLKNGSTLALRESSPNSFPCHFPTEEHDNGVKDDSSHSLLLGQKRLGQPDESHKHFWPSKIPKCSMQDVGQPGSSRNLKSVESGEGFHKFSSTTNSLRVANEMGTDQCHRKLMMGDSAFTQVKEPAFSNIFIIPTRQNYGDNETTLPFGNFTKDESRTAHIGIGTHLRGAHNESSTKTDTVYHNHLHRSSSLLGETFSRPSKCGASPNPRKSNSISDETLHRSLKTGITDRVADVSSSIPLPDNTSGCSRWVKRLQHNHSQIPPPPLCTKSFKRSEKQNMCSILCMKEEDKFEKTMTSSENLKSSLGDIEEDLQSWLRRWHYKTSPTASRPVEPFVFRSDNLRVTSDKFEGNKFASVGAMALMGKAIINYRPPFRFRRKEASLVWTT